MILDRTKEPKYKIIDSIDYIKAEPHSLENGIPLYLIRAGQQEVVRIDFLFSSGEWMQLKSLVADYTINMLQEGTERYSSEEIAEKLDFLGSYIYYSSSKHFCQVSVYTLTKHVMEVLGIIEEIIKRPLFPENKFAVHNGKKLQQYIIENEKVEVISQKHFSKALFGINHPYGRIPEKESFEQISVNDLFNYHKSHITANNCKIIVSGSIDETTIAAINKYFGGDDWKNNQTITIPTWEKIPSETYNIRIQKEDASQSAIRIGKEMVNKKHPDFPALQILNTVFGGYFGSRLMSNIREDKGYTYGIGSGIVSNLDAGYFVIVTQVGKNVVDAALKEIYFELDRLQSELIPDEELNMVKNYMMGTVLRNFDGAFALSDSFKTILEYDLGYDYYDKFIETITNIRSTDLQAMAISYFKDQNLYEVVAG